jgi:hypothetical protein
MRLRSLAVSLVCSAVAACHPGLRPGGSATEPGESALRQSPARSPWTITAAELQLTSASNLYDAILQLRPDFFTRRGATSFLNEPEHAFLVIINRRTLGGLAELRDIPVARATAVRRLSAAEIFQITALSAPAGGIEVVLGR